MPDVRTLEPKPSTAGTFRAAWPYLRAHRGIVTAAIVLSLLSTLAIVLMAPAVGFVTDALARAIRNDCGLAWASSRRSC